METQLTSILRLTYQPVVLQWSDQSPPEAVQFGKGKFGCVLSLFASAAKGKPGICDRETFGCFGGGVGVGFGNQYQKFPGGVDCFCRFLSTGNKGFPQGEAVAGHMKGKAPDHFLQEFLLGERYIKNPELTRRFVETTPVEDIPCRYAVFTPLSSIDPARPPENDWSRTVTFVVDPDQLSGLVVLATYACEDCNAVTIPFVAGCQAIGILPLREARSDNPHAIVGLVDISARVNVRYSLGRGLFTFSVPWKMFLRMEENIPGSFFDRDTWKKLMAER